MTTSETMVFVVDDDPSLRDALSSLIRSVGMGVETFSSAEEFIEAERPEIPSCLVLDVRMRGMSGLELQRELAGIKVNTPIIFITGHGDIPMSVRAMKAGAMEFLTKPFRDQELLDAVYRAIDADRARREEAAAFNHVRARFDKLTPREREVMKLIVSGLSNREIASALGTSENTVKTQRSQVMQKMAAESLADLVRMGEKLGASETSPA